MARIARRPEEVLHRQVADFLRVACPDGGPVLWLHVPNGGARSKAEAGVFKALGVRAGAADVLLIHRGRAFWVELKPKGRAQSDGQVAFESACGAAGSPYAVCRSLDEVEGTLRAWGIPMRASVAAGMAA